MTNAQSVLSQKGKQIIAIRNLKASLRYHLLNNLITFDLTVQERAKHLKAIHQEVLAMMERPYANTYTCLISSRVATNLNHRLQLVGWYKSIVNATIESLNKSSGDPSFHYSTFEVLAVNIGYDDTDKFRLWLLEYCYKTLTKKGRI